MVRVLCLVWVAEFLVLVLGWFGVGLVGYYCSSRGFGFVVVIWFGLVVGRLYW